MHHLFDVRNEDGLAYDDRGIAPLGSFPGGTVAFGRILPGGIGMQGLEAEGCEENAVVLSGVLAYPTAPGAERFAPMGAWVVTLPGEVHGYGNKGAKPVTLFLFRVRASSGSPARELRIFHPQVPRGGENRQTVYRTAASCGEVLGLHPGQPAAIPAARGAVLLVTEGRMMALFKETRLSLDTGEGLCLIDEPTELVGVGGRCGVALFSAVTP